MEEKKDEDEDEEEDGKEDKKKKQGKWRVTSLAWSMVSLYKLGSYAHNF